MDSCVASLDLFLIPKFDVSVYQSFSLGYESWLECEKFLFRGLLLRHLVPALRFMLTKDTIMDRLSLFVPVVYDDEEDGAVTVDVSVSTVVDDCDSRLDFDSPDFDEDFYLQSLGASSPADLLKEEFQKPSFLGHEHWGSVTTDESIVIDDEIIEDVQDIHTIMPIDYQLLKDEGCVEADWSMNFEADSPPKPKFRPSTTDVQCDPNVIQAAIDDIFPFHHEMDDRYFQTWVETQDISLEVSKCWLDASNFKDFTKGQSTYAQPQFQSGATSKRVNTQRETLLAVKKRNMNIPELQATFDLNAEIECCYNRFNLHVFDKSRVRRLPPLSGTEIKFFSDYIVGKNPPLSEYVGPLNLCSLDKYMHMVKTIVKPVEDNSLKYERPLCATITYHKKGIVMQSSPLFLSAMSRLFFCLKSKITVPSGKFHQLFTLSAAAFDAASWYKEVDFSKFDKSQGQLHHEVQKLIFKDLGLPNEFVDMWFTSHEVSHITDRDTGVGFSVDYQRRTGDANTYLGNTLVTLICLARVYDLSDPNITFVIASGDDSLIGSTMELPRNNESLFTSLFNFEAKFPHNQPFICSKFLISVDLEDGSREVIAVPNPAKLLIRMGRRDCQYNSLADLFTSWLDVVYYFRDSEVCRKVADLCAYRQKRGPSAYLLPALLSLPVCFSNRAKFLRLCYDLTPDVCLKQVKLKADSKRNYYLKNHENRSFGKQDRRQQNGRRGWFNKENEKRSLCYEKKNEDDIPSVLNEPNNYRSFSSRSSAFDGRGSERSQPRTTSEDGRKNSRLKYRPRNTGVHQS
nr:replicase protein 2a [Carpotroche-associated ilarvirus]